MGTKLAELLWAACFAEEGKRSSGLQKGSLQAMGRSVSTGAALIPNQIRDVSEQ